MAKKAISDIIKKILSMTEHYFQGKVNEYTRESGLNLISQAINWSEGDETVLVLKCRPSKDTLEKLAREFEEIEMQEKIEPINPQNTT
jgi:hypothetical protein